MSSDLDMRLWECERRIVRVGESIDRQMVRLSAVGQGARTLRWYGGAAVGGRRQSGVITITARWTDGRAIRKYDNITEWTDGLPFNRNNRGTDNLGVVDTAVFYTSPTTGVVAIDLTNGNYYSIIRRTPSPLTSDFIFTTALTVNFGTTFLAPPGAKSSTYTFGPQSATCEVSDGCYFFYTKSAAALKIKIGGGAYQAFPLDTGLSTPTWSLTTGGVTYTLAAYSVSAANVATGTTETWWRVGRMRWIEDGEISIAVTPNSADYTNDTLTWNAAPGGGATVKFYADATA
jgi:hypothetical protein